MMSAEKRRLPSGSVTFLFTDIEGSTRLLHELGVDAYGKALADHRRVLRAAFVGHGGVEVATEGDAFFAAFPTAASALQAASEAQDGLEDAPLRVRMGVHTGTAQVVDGDYVGSDVHLAARIAAAAHGGQVLVSAATAALVPGEDLTELGEHRLKDFPGPVRLLQLGSVPFPPVRTISNSNLPRPVSAFVGREHEVHEVASLLRAGPRLLTLTGPGGSGKTRLAMQAASELVGEFLAGVFWVALAPLRDPGLVIPTIAQTLGAKAELADHIGEGDMLLLLDNMEQVIAASPQLATLLEACPNLRCLVTSRELLRVRGEVEYPVPPLVDNEAVELFRTRSQVWDAPGVAELCQALENLPLAIELAAARTAILSPSQILERLSRRLDVLKGGRDVEARQGTLRAAIDWSYDLLSPTEQSLFARLAAFRGGCALEAAEEVAEADLDTLQSLVDKSLVRYRDGRYQMLETIREYAAERLESSGEREVLHRRHFDYFVAAAERAYAERFHSSSALLQKLGPEHGNFAAALDWAMIEHPREEAQLAGAIAHFWNEQGYGFEAHKRLTGALTRHSASDGIRARALTELGPFRLFFEPPEVSGNAQEARKPLDEALNLWREQGDLLGEALALEKLGYLLTSFDQKAPARAAFEQSLALRRQAGASELEVAGSLAGLCQLLVASDDFEAAEPIAQALYDLATRNDAASLEGLALHYLADCPLLRGDYQEAEKRYRRGLAHARRRGMVLLGTNELLGVAMSLAAQGDNEEAIRLAAAAYAQRERLGIKGPSPMRFWRRLQDRYIGGARAHVSKDDLEAAERAGRSVPFEFVVDEVLAEGARAE